ncbi:MAG: beta-hexosaminidase [Candidatus Aminicenantes bacterium]|nr:beta-hexosaminidase [Candidatus Aminicenantes bacterium]
MRTFFIGPAAVCLLTAASAAAPLEKLDLMPVPSSVVLTEGRFRVDERFAVAAIGKGGERARRAAARFMARLAGRTGLFFKQDFLNPEDSPGAGCLFRYDRPGELVLGEDESYAVTVSPDRVLLVARTDIGVLRGFETILQLLCGDRQGYYFPCVQVSDAPRFAWRGLLIDCARHFMPVDVIKRNLDGMAAVKMNVFHWHLTDHQGFRVESRLFPRLHEQGSDGMYYSQAQLREVIAYAADRGIRVMPEFDIPAHSTSWFVGYPEFASGPGPYRLERRFGLMPSAFDPSHPAVYEFFDKYFGEMAGLFPDHYLHAGGDENSGRAWDENPEIRRFKSENNLPDNPSLQAYFTGRILEILERHGRRLVGWDEILHPGLSRSAVIQAWRGADRLAAAVRQGHAAVLSHGYYIDLCQPAAFHYANDPVPPEGGLAAAERNFVLGGEATMWSELVSAETIDGRIWPRTAAIAERLWSPAEVRDAEDMYRRLEAVGILLEDLGLTHYKNQDMMLRRLVGGEDIAALKVLVSVVEPLKRYQRLNQGRAYTVLSPLSLFADAALPESGPARRFGTAVQAFLRTGDRKTADEIRRSLREWRGLPETLAPLLSRSPVLAEVGPLAKNLSAAGSLGLKALDLIQAKKGGDADWVGKSLQTLARARRPEAQTELAVIPHVERLVKAAGRRS